MFRKEYILILSTVFTIIFYIPQISHSSEDKTGIDVVLVMDSSGSMKKTDPMSLRIPAAKMFISLLDKKDRAAVVSFSDKGYPILQMTSTESKENNDKLLSAANKISSKGAYTNLYDALLTGKDVVSKDSPEREKIIILMTDGMMDTGNKMEDGRLASMITDLLVKEFEKPKITVYTIAFTEYSDAKLLQGIAVMTGGMYNLALSDKDLHQVFASIFESAKKPEMLPIDENGLMVDRSIEELTIVASKSKPETTVSIELPDGNRISSKDKKEGTAWFSSPAFDMVTVQKPDEGRWKILYSTGEDKAYIVSNMKLMTDFGKSNMPVNKPITVKAWFEKDGALLQKKEILETTDILLELIHSDVGPAKMTPGGEKEGIFTGQLVVQNPGTYELSIIAKGKTFQRERTFKFDVTAPVAGEGSPQPVKKEEKQAAKSGTTLKDQISWRDVLLKFTIMLAIVFLGTAIFFFKKYRALLAGKEAHLSVPEELREEKENALQHPESASTASAEEVEKLKAEIASQKKEIEELLVYRRMLDRVQAKFVEMKEFNAKLKGQLTLVITKVEKNEELEKMMADFEQKSRELNAFASALESENLQLSRQTDVFETEIERLSKTLDESVDKGKYERLSEENQGLKQRIAELETASQERQKAYEDMVKKYDALESEYTILYEKHQG